MPHDPHLADEMRKALRRRVGIALAAGLRSRIDLAAKYVRTLPTK